MFDTEKFMREVEQRPIIYDLQLKDYSNRRMKAKCWFEVGESMCEEWNAMKSEEKTVKVKLMMKKWKTLRDNFVREYKLIRKAERGMTASKKKRYIFFCHLKFLIPHLRKNKNTASKISSPDDASQPHSSTEQIDYSDNNNNQQHFNQTQGYDGVNENCCSRKSGNNQGICNKRKAILTAIKKLIDILSQSISFQKEERSSDQFGNKAFMLSFLPLMNNLPQHVSLQVRMKILQIFKDLADSVFFNNLGSPESCLSTLSPSAGLPTPVPSDIEELSNEIFSIPDFLHL